jgi:small conductance mechanosensitive channel
MGSRLRDDILTTRFWQDEGRELVHNALNSLLQIGGILLAYAVLRTVLFRLIDGVLARLLSREARLGQGDERTGRLQTLQGLCKSLLSYVLFFVFGVMLLHAVGFNIMPFITTAGVLGLAIGFGAQKLVKDVISGFFIIVDNLFVVGETVTIGPVTGQVIEMGMRVTRLRDAGGKLYLLANGDIGTVINLSRYPVTDYVEVNVAASADLNRVVEVVQAAGEKLFAAEDSPLRVPPAVVGMIAFSAASMTVRVSVVTDPRHLAGEQMRVRGALRAALVEAGIPLA